MKKQLPKHSFIQMAHGLMVLQCKCPEGIIFHSINLTLPDIPQFLPHRLHSCGVIKGDNPLDYSIIVAGGDDGNNKYLDYVEILSSLAPYFEWENGPSLPQPIFAAQIVEYEAERSVVLIGGNTESGQRLDTLYQLEAENKSAGWRMLVQRLSSPRSDHVAFMVTDEMCSNKM